jgi:hypothetical protein
MLAVRVTGLKSMGFEYQLMEQRKLQKRRQAIAANMIQTIALVSSTYLQA